MSKARQINFEQAVFAAFGQVKDFTLAMRIARYFYEKAEKDYLELFKRVKTLLDDFGNLEADIAKDITELREFMKSMEEE